MNKKNLPNKICAACNKAFSWWKKWSLNWADGKKLGLNTLFVSLAAGLTYLGTQVGNIDWGSATALVVPIAALLLGTATQWAKDNSEKE